MNTIQEKAICALAWVIAGVLYCIGWVLLIATWIADGCPRCRKVDE
jgi:hypothetical protein